MTWSGSSGEAAVGVAKLHDATPINVNKKARRKIPTGCRRCVFATVAMSFASDRGSPSAMVRSFGS
jgi:hypothetical protein